MLVTLNVLTKENGSKKGEEINRIKAKKINPDDVLFIAPATVSDVSSGTLVPPSREHLPVTDGPMVHPRPEFKYSNDHRTFNAAHPEGRLYVVQTTKSKFVVTQQPPKHSDRISPLPEVMIREAGVALLTRSMREEFRIGFVIGHINLAHTKAEDVHPHFWNPLSKKSTIPFDNGAQIIVEEPAEALRIKVTAAKIAKMHKPA